MPTGVGPIPPLPNLPGGSTRKYNLDKINEPGNTPPIEPEIGSSFSYNQLFTGYQDGMAFTYDDPNIDDMKRMIDTDGNAASVEQLLSFPIIAAPWEIKGKKGDKGETEFLRTMYGANEHNGGMKTPIETVVAQMTWAMTVKRVYFEKTFKVSDLDPKHPYVYDKISWRPPESCEMALNAANSEVLGFRQAPMIDYGPDGQQVYRQRVDANGYIPIYGPRAFVYVHGQWRSPINGISSMQVPYWCWITKQKIRYLWYQFLEQQSLPKTIVRNEDEEQARIDARKVATLRSRDVLGIGSDSEIETLESSGKGADQFITAISWLDNEMSASMVDKFSGLGGNGATGAGGSYALSQNFIQLYLRIRRYVARDMARAITNGIHAPIIRYNFGSDGVVPDFQFGPLNEANEDSIMTMFSALTQTSQAGKLPIAFLEELTIRVANIMEIDPAKIQAQFDEHNKNIDPNDPMGQMVGTVQAATAMVQQAASAQPGQPVMGDTTIPNPNAGVNKNTFNAGNAPTKAGSGSVANGGGRTAPYN
jgi:hypothetical protein